MESINSLKDNGDIGDYEICHECDWKDYDDDSKVWIQSDDRSLERGREVFVMVPSEDDFMSWTDEFQIWTIEE